MQIVYDARTPTQPPARTNSPIYTAKFSLKNPAKKTSRGLNMHHLFKRLVQLIICYTD